MRAVRQEVQDQGRSHHPHEAESPGVAGDMRRMRQDLPQQPQSVHSSEARTLQGQVRVPAVPSATGHPGESGSARVDAAREEGEVGVRGVRQDLLRELRSTEAYEDSYGRQAVQLYGLQQSFRQAQQP